MATPKKPKTAKELTTDDLWNADANRFDSLDYASAGDGGIQASVKVNPAGRLVVTLRNKGYIGDEEIVLPIEQFDELSKAVSEINKQAAKR